MNYDQKLIGKIIKSEREKLNLTQAELGKILIKSEKQISKYENGALFPPIDELARLCTIFNCELGYLLGEKNYSYKTKLNTLLVEELGLPFEVINKIRMITGKEPGLNGFMNYKNDRYKEMFCKFVLCDSFLELLDSAFYMNDCVEGPNKELERIKNKYSEKLIEKVEKLMRGITDYVNDPDAPKLTKEEKEAYKDLNEYEGFCFDNTFEQKIWRYEFSECCRSLFNEMFPEEK